jgi:polysaccharide biosynthesis transport protein
MRDDSQSHAPQGAIRSTALQLRRSTDVSTHVSPANEEVTLDDQIHLRDILRILIKRKWTIVAVFTLAVLAAFFATFLMTPIYQASAVLHIDRLAPKILDQSKDVTPVESAGDRDFVQTQFELLRSRTLSERVIEEVGLAKRTDNTLASVKSGNEAVGVHERLRRFFSEVRGLEPAALVPSEVRQSDAVLRSYQAALSIEPIRGSRLVRVQFRNPDPELAAKVANTIAQAYIATTLERRFDASSYAKTFLEDKIKQTKAKLEDSERTLNEFSRDQQIIAFDDKRSIDSKVLEEYSGAVSKAESERIKAEVLFNQLAVNPDATAQILENKVIQSLKETKAKYETEYQEKLRIYKPAFPAMLQLQSQIDETQKRIESEIKSIRLSVKSTFDAAKAQEVELKSKLEGAKRAVLDLQNRSIQYNILKREVDTSRTMYDGLLQRFKEVGVQGGIESNNISIVDRAVAPILPFQPRLTNNIGIGALVGLILGIGLVFFLEYLDDSIKFADDVERFIGLPLLGVIPKVAAAGKEGSLAMGVQIDPRSSFSEAYRSVRTALQFSTSMGAPKRVVITSCGKNEGKSTTSLSLAIQFAQLGSPVLLIDGDMRNPSVHKLLGIQNTQGLSNFLSAEIDPIEVTRKTAVPHLYAITAGPLPPNPVELLASPKTLHLFRNLTERFSHVIIDAPPVLGIADPIVLANQAENTIFVVEAAKTRKANIRQSLRRLYMAGIKPVGVILTKAGTHDGLYGYESNYYYYYGSDSQPAKPGKPEPEAPAKTKWG